MRCLILALAVMVTAITACVPYQSAYDLQVNGPPEVQFNEFTGRTSVSMANPKVDMIDGHRPAWINMRGMQTDGEDSFALTVSYVLREWVFFERAAANGKTYFVDVQDREVSETGASMTERVMVLIPKEDIGGLKSDGLRILLSGTRGLSSFSIGADRFREFFDVYDTVQWD